MISQNIATNHGQSLNLSVHQRSLEETKIAKNYRNIIKTGEAHSSVLKQIKYEINLMKKSFVLLKSVPSIRFERKEINCS
jgi:hypothetical protein